MKKTYKAIEHFWIFLVFLFSLNFLAKPNHLLVIVLLFGVLLGYKKSSSLRINDEFFFLLLFSLTYFLSIFKNDISGERMAFGSVLIFLLGPFSCYLVGYLTVKKENRGFVFKTLLAIVFANFLHGFLNMLIYFRDFGFAPSVVGNRAFTDIWTKTDISATSQNTFYTPVISLLFFSLFLFKEKKRKSLSLTIMAAIFFAIMASFIMGNRTPIAVIILIFILNYILYTYLNRGSQKNFLKMILIVIGFISLLSFSYYRNILGMRSFVTESTLYDRTEQMDIEKDPRFEIWQRVFSQMFDHPWGGYKIDLGRNSYAHNLWLDVFYAAGIIPFFLLILYTIKTLNNLIIFIKRKNIDTEFKLFFFSIYTGFFLNFMVEPILEGVPYMFLTFCLFNGMIRKYLYVSREMKINANMGEI